MSYSFFLFLFFLRGHPLAVIRSTAAGFQPHFNSLSNENLDITGSGKWTLKTYLSKLRDGNISPCSASGDSVVLPRNFTSCAFYCALFPFLSLACSVNEERSRSSGFEAFGSYKGNFETDSQVVFNGHPSSELVPKHALQQRFVVTVDYGANDPSNTQLYPCTSSEVAKLGLPTSFGGSLVHAKGFTVNSSYLIKPRVCFDVCPSETLRKSSSLSNPFDGTTLYAEGVTASLSTFFGNSRETDTLILKKGKFHGSTSIMFVLDANEVVQLGNYCCQWISIKNPSPERVIAHLILNSGPEQASFKVSNVSMIWMCVKKTLIFLFISVLLYLLVCPIFSRLIAFKPEDFRTQKNSILPAIREFNSLHMKSNLVISFAMSSKMKVFLSGEEIWFLESVGRCSDVNPHKKIDSLLKLSWVENSDMEKVSSSENLSVRVGKDKRKKRRKKNTVEVSSSQRSNSSASSSLSPVASRKPLALEPNWQYIKSKCSKLFSKVNTLEDEVTLRRKNYGQHFYAQKKPNLMRKVNAKPAVFLSMRYCPVLGSTSKLALHERAPGSKIHNRRTGEVEAKKDFKEKFTYDIWGDHLFGPPPS